MKKNVYFVSGIDTNIGKSYATAYLALQWRQQGVNTITQKFIQTGNPAGYSEDIELHRRLMGTGPLPEDQEGLTKPQIFSYPASPDLASRIDGRPIDFEAIRRATDVLSQRYDAVLMEGAGGLMVPLTPDLLTIDYIRQQGYPLVFVTSGRLGSVNHTLLSFEAIQARGIQLHTVLYNLYPEGEDKIIQADTEQYIRRYLAQHFPEAQFLKVPCLPQ
jgi:dethiobiotin synthetase